MPLVKCQAKGTMKRASGCVEQRPDEPPLPHQGMDEHRHNQQQRSEGQPGLLHD